MLNVILSGGSGTRMWPLSRKKMPKQYYPLINGESLFQKTVARNLKICSSVLVVTNEVQAHLAQEQLPSGFSSQFILEPIGRDTAAAIALACFSVDADTILLVTPSDHLINDEVAYKASLEQAKLFAQAGYLVTFGIEPSYPETGFGYIEAQGSDVVSFKEKPDYETATAYLSAGNYYWNSGMFCFKSGVFLEELKRYSPDVYQKSLAAYEGSSKTFPLSIGLALMQAIPSISVDYGVMEQSKKVKVVPANIAWSDLGSLDSLYDELDKNAVGNTVSERHYSINSNNNLMISDRWVATIDIDDLLIVDSADALLICKRGSSQHVKKVVNDLSALAPHLVNTHLKTAKPWGKLEILTQSVGFLVQKVTLFNGKTADFSDVYRSVCIQVLRGSISVRFAQGIQNLVVGEPFVLHSGSSYAFENTSQSEGEAVLLQTVFDVS